MGFPSEKMTFRARETDLSIKCLWHEREALSLIPSIHVIRLGMEPQLVFPKDPLAAQAAQMNP